MKLRKFLSVISSLIITFNTGVCVMAEDKLYAERFDMTNAVSDSENGIVFETELENGDYTVTVTTGGKTKTEANIYINGGERVRKYTLEEDTVQENPQPVVITDGKLIVQVLGENPNVTEIKIEEIAPRKDPGEKPTIFIAGDSTAQTYDHTAVYPQTGWGQTFHKMFTDDVIVENRSMGGRSSKSYNNDGRLDRILTELKPGDYVFIQFGINDGAVNKPERYISVEDYKKLISEKYIGETVKRGGIPVLMTPSASSWWDDENNNYMESRADYADPTREIAKDLGVKFIDANRLMTDAWNTMGKEEVSDLYFVCEPLESKAYPSGTNDRTHLKESGALKVSEIIASAIPECVPELGAYLKGDESFFDITSHWAYTYIDTLSKKGIIEGVGDNLFNPDGTITRAEFLKMAMEVSNIPGHAYRKNECLDVQNSDRYCYYMQSAVDKGLIPYQMIENATGIEEKDKVLADATEEKEAVTAKVFVYNGEGELKFNGNNPITREEMAVIAMNCLSYALSNSDEPLEIKPFKNVGEFTDSDISDAYLNSIDAAVSYGLIEGMGDNTFAPKATLTRAQAATVALKLLNLLK